MYWRQPHFDYMELPLEARMRNTRFRWWQVLDDSTVLPPVGWSIDDVYIGGSEINPAVLEEHFEGNTRICFK